MNCTVIFVAIDGSQNAASSWAAKMFSGLCLQDILAHVSEGKRESGVIPKVVCSIGSANRRQATKMMPKRDAWEYGWRREGSSGLKEEWNSELDVAAAT